MSRHPRTLFWTACGHTRDTLRGFLSLLPLTATWGWRLRSGSSQEINKSFNARLEGGTTILALCHNWTPCHWLRTSSCSVHALTCVLAHVRVPLSFPPALATPQTFVTTYACVPQEENWAQKQLSASHSEYHHGKFNKLVFKDSSVYIGITCRTMK